MIKRLYLLIVILFFCLPIFATFTLELQNEKIIKLGDVAKFTVIVTNHGEVTNDIVLRLQIPEGFKYKDRPTGDFSFRWNIGTMQKKEEKIFSCELETTKSGDYSYMVILITGNSSIQQMQKLQIVSPGLVIKLDGSSRLIFINKQVLLTNTIQNRGNGDAENVKIVLSFPDELEYVSSEPPGIYRSPRREKNATLTWFLDKISPQQEIKLNCRGRAIDCMARGIIRATVFERDKVFEDEFAVRARCCGSAPHLSTYDTEDPLEVGSETIYVVTARNEGTSTITNVQYKSHIPEEMQFVLARAPMGFVYDMESHTVIFDSFPALAPGDSLVFKVVCKAIRQGSAKHTARLKYEQFDKDIIDEEGTSVYE